MGYALLWIEDLTFWLLLAALAVAVASRWTRWWTRAALLLLLIGMPLLMIGLVTTMLAVMKFQTVIYTGLFYPVSMLLACMLIGSLTILVWGRGRDSDQQPRACNWRRGPLALTTLVALLLHAMTFWNLDLSVRQQMDAMRIEAGALALSVSPPQVSDRENAALVYQQAFDAGLVADYPPAFDEWWTEINDDPDSFDVSDEEFVDYIRRKGPLLRLVREAAALPSCSFPRDWGRPNLAMLLPEIQNLRGAARDLTLEARYHAERGDVREALENILAIHQIAQHAGQEPLLVSLLVSFALDSMAADSLESLLRTYPIRSDDLAPLAAWHLLPTAPKLQRAFRMEEAMGVAMFCQVADWRDMDDAASTLGLQSGWGPNISPLYRVFLLSEDLKTYRRFMTRWQRASIQPFAARRQAIDELTRTIKESPRGIMTQLLLPALEQCHEAAAISESRQRLVQMAIAAHRFRLQEGDLPASWDALREQQQVFIPSDPFDGQPLRLIRRDDTTILYSIGPDLSDDQAAAYDHASKTGDISFTLQIPPVSAAAEAAADN